MNKYDYAHAVARIRYNEMKLLKSKDIEQLLSASDYSDTLTKIKEHGYSFEKSRDAKQALDNELLKAWKLLQEIAPEKELLDVFGVLNAFHNLKSALKSRVSRSNDEPYYLFPSSVEASVIEEAVKINDFSLLPDYMTQAAKKGYKALTENEDGQLSEAIIDKAALSHFLLMSKKTECEEVIKAANLKCAEANIKIAYRAAVTGKEKGFYEASLSECDGIDINLLSNAAQKGVDELLEYLKTTRYKEAAALLTVSSIAFEKWFDNFLIVIIENAKVEPFGFAPLAAYWFAKEAEIKNIRILLNGKKNNVDNDTIRERMRRLYV